MAKIKRKYDEVETPFVIGKSTITVVDTVEYNQYYGLDAIEPEYFIEDREYYYKCRRINLNDYWIDQIEAQL